MRQRSKWLVLDTLRKGQSFNEMSALGELESPFSVEVCSEKAVLLKIPIELFKTHFGGEEGNKEPIMQQRGNMIMKINWLRMKKQFLAYMSKEKLEQLEYRDDRFYERLQPSRQIIREPSYM